jgi:multimeric flavodoxin WrbA
MKVVGINGSPRKEGNTARLIQEVFNELNRQEIDTEMISLSGPNIRGCTACGACMKQKNKKCLITDDFFNVYLEKMIAADGIIFGSPVYSA